MGRQPETHTGIAPRAHVAPNSTAGQTYGAGGRRPSHKQAHRVTRYGHRLISTEEEWQLAKLPFIANITAWGLGGERERKGRRGIWSLKLHREFWNSTTPPTAHLSLSTYPNNRARPVWGTVSAAKAWASLVPASKLQDPGYTRSKKVRLCSYQDPGFMAFAMRVALHPTPQPWPGGSVPTELRGLLAQCRAAVRTMSQSRVVQFTPLPHCCDQKGVFQTKLVMLRLRVKEGMGK